MQHNDLENVPHSPDLRQPPNLGPAPPEFVSPTPTVKPQSQMSGAITAILLAVLMFAAFAGVAAYASLINSTPYTAITEIFFYH